MSAATARALALVLTLFGVAYFGLLCFTVLVEPVNEPATPLSIKLEVPIAEPSRPVTVSDYIKHGMRQYPAPPGGWSK